MRSLFLLTSISLLAACNSTSDVSSTDNYALYKNGIVLRHHVDQQSCKAAAMRANVKMANEANSALRSAKSEPVKGGVVKAICREV